MKLNGQIIWSALANGGAFPDFAEVLKVVGFAVDQQGRVGSCHSERCIDRDVSKGGSIAAVTKAEESSCALM